MKEFMGFAAPAPEAGPFSLLPKTRTPWSEFVFSYGVQAVIVSVFVWIPVLHPEVLEASRHNYQTIELVPTPPPVNHAPQRRLPPPPIVAHPDPPTPPPRPPAPPPTTQATAGH